MLWQKCTCRCVGDGVWLPVFGVLVIVQHLCLQNAQSNTAAGSKPISQAGVTDKGCLAGSHTEKGLPWLG